MWNQEIAFEVYENDIDDDFNGAPLSSSAEWGWVASYVAPLVGRPIAVVLDMGRPVGAPATKAPTRNWICARHCECRCIGRDPLPATSLQHFRPRYYLCAQSDVDYPRIHLGRFAHYAINFAKSDYN